MQEPYIGHIYKGTGGVRYEELGKGYDPDSYILLRQDDGFGFTAYGARTVWGRIRWDYIHDGAYKDSPHRFTGGRAV